MEESITVHVPLGVHKDNIETAIAPAGLGGELRHVGSVGGCPVALSQAPRLAFTLLPSNARYVLNVHRPRQG